MPKQKKQVLATLQSTNYYAARVVQRITLLLAVTGTVILWIALFSTSLDYAVVNIGNPTPELLNEYDAATGGITDSLANYAVAFSLIAAAVSLLLIYIPRIRKYEKRLVIDGVLIAGFCLFMSVFCQAVLRFILVRVI